METKKVPTADLEERRPGFLAIGLLTALSASLVAFEWTTHHRSNLAAGSIADVGLEEEIAPPSAHPPPPAPPPPAPPERIEIVDNTVEVPEALAPDTEITEVDPVMPALLPNEEVEPELPFQVVEDMPEFPGGHEALTKYLQKNLNYPEMAARTGTQGTVFVNFEVDKEGRIKNVSVLRGIGAGCDQEAVRVVKAMPQWSPGMQRGKPVRVTITLPVKFKLI